VPGKRRGRLFAETLLNFQSAHNDSPLYLGGKMESEHRKSGDNQRVMSDHFCSTLWQRLAHEGPLFS
jgi:hypothetical protein